MMLRMKGLVVGTKGGGETVVIGTGYQESLQGAKGQVARGLPEAKGAQGAQEALVLTRVALVEHQERSNNINSLKNVLCSGAHVLKSLRSLAHLS